MRQYGCDACHIIPGIRGAHALVGPSLEHTARRMYIAGVLSNTPENMLRWLQNPPAVDALTAMPDMGVTEADARDMAGYLYTLHCHASVETSAFAGMPTTATCMNCHAHIGVHAPVLWCLACHRKPHKFIRPREHVFNMEWQPPGDQDTLSQRLVEQYKIQDAHSLTTCSTCRF